jgi:hypothetical protein
MCYPPPCCCLIGDNRIKPVVDLWNDLDNLNMTPDWLNQKKGDAFEVWKVRAEIAEKRDAS